MLDLLIKNVTVVTTEDGALPSPQRLDLGIEDGKFARVEPTSPRRTLPRSSTVGGSSPSGVVDAHQHWGIYNPLEEDTVTESRASAQGGVTTGITYMRTGQYYLNQTGSLPGSSQGARAARVSFVDYAFHLAPMMREHIDEIPSSSRVRRSVLQDLHVLRQPRTARQVRRTRATSS